ITKLFPTLSVEENLAIAVRGLSTRKFSFFGRPQLDEQEAPRIAQALEICRLADRRNRIVKELSYGEQRQLELALALAHEPRLLLLDEPAAGLSPAERSLLPEIIPALPRPL